MPSEWSVLLGKDAHGQPSQQATSDLTDERVRFRDATIAIQTLPTCGA